MNTIIRRCAACLFACILAGLMFAVPAYAATKADVTAARKKAQAMEEERRKTEKKISELESIRSDTAAYVKQLDQELGALADELEALEAQIADKEQEIVKTTEDLHQAEQTEQEQYEAMKLRIRYMYEKGDTTMLDMLLSAGTVSELLNRAEYIEEISTYDRDMLDNYKAVKLQIADDKAKLEEDKAVLEDMQAETEAKQASVQTLADAKNAEIRALTSEIGEQQELEADYERQIAAQNAEIARMEEEIRKAEEEARRRAEEEARRKAEEERKRKEEEARRAAEAAKNSAPKSSGSSGGSSKGTGSLTWPCPASGYITSGFGSRSSPKKGASSYHQGIDIGAATGTGIVAADSGTVSIASYSSSAGNYIMISHGNGLSTVYMHCSKLLVSEGDTVKKGQTIAKVGNTGISTGPHLHFGVRKNGTYVNPSNYVSP